MTGAEGRGAKSMVSQIWGEIAKPILLMHQAWCVRNQNIISPFTCPLSCLIPPPWAPFLMATKAQRLWFFSNFSLSLLSSEPGRQFVRSVSHICLFLYILLQSLCCLYYLSQRWVHVVVAWHWEHWCYSQIPGAISLLHHLVMWARSQQDIISLSFSFLIS